MAKGNFPACHAVTSAWEGGWSDHDQDPGGATMYGVTIGTLSKWRGRKVTKAEVKALTRKEAEQIYKAWYWDAVKADSLPAGVDLAIYDFAVNSGPSRAKKALQKALGVAQDGAIGPVTLAALQKADPVELIETVCGLRMDFLRGLPTWKTFGKGWTNRVNDVVREAMKMAEGHGVVITQEPNNSGDSDAKADVPVIAPRSLLSLILSFLSKLFRRS